MTMVYAAAGRQFFPPNALFVLPLPFLSKENVYHNGVYFPNAAQNHCFVGTALRRIL